jgi:uncharacterized protein (TIGR00255 family)
MALSSMTGFARSHGVSAGYAWAWEIKSVNGKGLDVRLRLPPGWEAVEVPVRARAGSTLARGNVFATLTAERKVKSPEVRINAPVLDAVIATMGSIAKRIETAPPRLDGILALRGVMEVVETQEGEAERRDAEQAIVDGFHDALVGLVEMRRHEGDSLGNVLSQRLVEIAALAARAEATPGRSAEAVRSRLADQIAALLDTTNRLDPERLHQEAILLASKADIREELDRLASHVVHAERLINEGGPVGRKLDFLAQEFNREANTLCAKSNDVELTKIGLELKSVVEQFREQVQNLE